MDDFLPAGYVLPDSSDLYFKLKPGANRFRVLASAITGKKGWKENEDGVKKPVRKHPDEPFSMEEIDDPEEIRTFWAMPIWDYASKSVKIWEPTQTTILKKMVSLVHNEAFGSPLGYDLYIEKSGEGMKTKYEVTANPPKPIDDEIVREWAKVTDKGFDLNELYDGGDPWNPKKVV